jgi:hypothetical protein
VPLPVKPVTVPMSAAESNNNSSPVAPEAGRHIIKGLPANRGERLVRYAALASRLAIVRKTLAAASTKQARSKSWSRVRNEIQAAHLRDCRQNHQLLPDSLDIIHAVSRRAEQRSSTGQIRADATYH